MELKTELKAESRSNLLVHLIQEVTVFDTRRTTVTHAGTRATTVSCTKTGANAFTSTSAHRLTYSQFRRTSAVQELLRVGWGSA